MEELEKGLKELKGFATPLEKQQSISTKQTLREREKERERERGREIRKIQINICNIN